MREQLLLLSHCKVHHRSYACKHVGTVIIESLCRIFDINWNRQICRFDILLHLSTAVLLAKVYHLVAKMHRRDKAQCHILRQAQFAQHSHREAGVICCNISKPRFLRRLLWSMYISIIGKLQILHMQPKKKAIMPATHINIRAILHFAFLRKAILWSHQKHHQCNHPTNPRTSPVS